MFNNNDQNRSKLNQMGTGLTRYRSAPSSYFDAVGEDDHFETSSFMISSNSQLLPPRNKEPELQQPLSQVIYQGGSSLIRQRSTPTGFFNNIEEGFSWDDDPSSTVLSDSFLNELVENKSYPNVNVSDFVQNNNEVGNQPITRLSHHLSLPSSSSDSVPMRIRAKRGFATHPRSIAERVRRTKISERMRKLQELVPNMDKQTNTADMLDLAVDYIKDLQTQVKKFSDNRAKCSCSAEEKPN